MQFLYYLMGVFEILNRNDFKNLEDKLPLWQLLWKAREI